MSIHKAFRYIASGLAAWKAAQESGIDSSTRPVEYAIWNAMMQRCHNPNYNDYPRYGGRGIRVSKRWQTFANFYHDMGKKPSGGSIERIDNNKGYSAGNCKWVTQKEQSRNKSSNRNLKANGKTKVLADWAKELGVTKDAVAYHLNNGKSMSDVVRHFNGKS